MEFFFLLFLSWESRGATPFLPDLVEEEGKISPIEESFKKIEDKRPASLDAPVAAAFLGFGKHFLPPGENLVGGERANSYTGSALVLGLLPLGERFDLSFQGVRDFSTRGEHFVFGKMKFLGRPPLRPELTGTGIFFGVRGNRRGGKVLSSWRLGFRKRELKNVGTRPRSGLVLSPLWPIVVGDTRENLVLLSLSVGNLHGLTWRDGRLSRPNYDFGARLIHLSPLWGALKIAWMVGAESIKQSEKGRVFRYGSVRFAVGLGY